MKHITLLCVLLLWIPAASWCQQVDGSLEGFILDASGQPLVDAVVTVGGPSLQGSRSVATDRAGHFAVLALPVGEYALRVAHIAHQPAALKEVAVRLGVTTNLGPIRLERVFHNVPEVVVTGRPAMVDPKTTTLGATLTQSSIVALPTDRDFRSLVALAPGATVGFLGEEPSVAGSTGEGNYYFIDGTDATDPIGAGTSIRLPYEFVRALEIKTGGYDAEFGRALGAIVNVVTPSGGDETHGQVFGYFTNHDLSGTTANSLVYAGSAFSAYDIGGSCGGPLVRERLWWFAAYNPAFDQRDLAVPGIPTQGATNTSQRLAAKLTWRASDRTNLNLTVLGDPTRARIVGVPFGFAPPPAQALNEDAIVATTRSGGVNVALHALHQLRPNVLLRGSVSRVHNRSFVSPVSERGRTEPFFVDFETNTVSGGYGGENRNYADRAAARISAAAFLGTHAIKVGAEYVDNWSTQDIQFGAGKNQGGFLFRNDATSYFWFQGFALGEVHMRVPTVYAQDSWRATRRLRINAGLRWDGSDLVDAHNRSAMKITDGFQPRLGVTYLVGPGERHKVSGSYGRVYEQLPAGSPGYYFFDSMQLSILYDHDPRVDPSGGDSTVLLPSPPGLGDVRGQYFDEFAMGLDSEPIAGVSFGVHGRYRRLGEVIEDAYSPAAGRFLIGNPGRGALDYLPKAKQEYRALEFTLKHHDGRGTLDASYVLSRSSGNYAGLWIGNAGPQFDFVDAIPNADGTLPNDRTHVFKIYGAYTTGFGLTAGATWVWQSGTPLNELGANQNVPYGPVFLRERGSAGRAPSLWDLNLRLSHEGFRLRNSLRPRLVLDLFHVFNPRRAVQLDERHYLAADALGNQLSPNPNYLQPTLFQPPFSARFGVVVAF